MKKISYHQLHYVLYRHYVKRAVQHWQPKFTYYTVPDVFDEFASKRKTPLVIPPFLLWKQFGYDLQIIFYCVSRTYTSKCNLGSITQFITRVSIRILISILIIRAAKHYFSRQSRDIGISLLLRIRIFCCLSKVSKRCNGGALEGKRSSVTKRYYNEEIRLWFGSAS